MKIADFKNFKEYNFFSYICTPWQIKTVEVAINSLIMNEQQIKGIVFVVSHKISGKVITVEQCPQLENITWIEIEYEKFGEMFNELNCLKKCVLQFLNFYYKENIFVFCPGIISISWLYLISEAFRKHVTFILGDDGVIGYCGYGEKQNILKEKNYSYLLNRLNRMGRIIDQRVLRKTKTGYVRNEGIAKEYENVLAHAGISLDNSIIEALSDKILIVTQCIFDNGQISGEQDLKALQHLYDALGELNKIVVVKPHPREKSLDRYEKFGWKVLKGIKMTQEEIFAKLEKKPKMIVGIYSATLVNMKALFNVETVSLASFYLNEDIGKAERETCNNFISEFDGFVTVPKTDKELQDILCKI